MKVDFDGMTRRFLLGESKGPTLESRIQALREVLAAFKPRSTSEQRRLEIANDHLNEIKRAHRKLLDEKIQLEEELKVLKENSPVTINE